jgi:hypothetical protein
MSLLAEALLKDLWPHYATGPKDHMHALGVISVNFNLFETSLIAIFAQPFIRAGVPRDECSRLFGGYSNEQRLDVMRTMYRGRGWSDEARDHIEHLIGYWSACFQNRNLLMHAHLQLPKHSQLLYAFLDPAEAHLSLQKPREKKNWSQYISMRLSLPHLRAIADQMYAGWSYSTDLALALIDNQEPLRGLLDFRRPWPEKPRIPGVIQERRREEPEDEPLLPLPLPELFEAPQEWFLPPAEGEG